MALVGEESEVKPAAGAGVVRSRPSHPASTRHWPGQTQPMPCLLSPVTETITKYFFVLSDNVFFDKI